MSEVTLPEQEADRNVFVWLTWLYSLLTGKAREEHSSSQTTWLLNSLLWARIRSECLILWASVCLWKQETTFDRYSVVVRVDVMAADAVIMVDELTRFYLSEEGSSLHWLSVGLVRHMCSWGNGLIQCLGHGTEDLSQSSESLWRHKLLLKDLRSACQSVCFFSRDWEERFFFPINACVCISDRCTLAEINNASVGGVKVQRSYWEENVLFITGDCVL